MARPGERTGPHTIGQHFMRAVWIFVLLMAAVVALLGCVIVSRL